MKYTAMTCNRAIKELGSAPRPYGYTLAINPPIEYAIDGEDIEGIGWVPYQHRKIVVKWQGWYKFKKDAESRAAELNKSHDTTNAYNLPAYY
jgi:hypothetical protein